MALALLSTTTLLVTACATDVPSAGPPPLSSIKEKQDKTTAMMVACLSDAGWEVDHDSVTGTVDIELPKDQFERYSEARRACIGEVEKLFPAEPLTEKQLDEIYEYEMWLAECLRGEDVPVEQLPSSQAFKDAYRSGDPWLSYSFIGDVSEEKYRALSETCPQL